MVNLDCQLYHLDFKDLGSPWKRASELTEVGRKTHTNWVESFWGKGGKLANLQHWLISLYFLMQRKHDQLPQLLLPWLHHQEELYPWILEPEFLKITKKKGSGEVVESDRCSWRGPGFSSQCHMVAYIYRSEPPVLGDLTPSVVLCRHLWIYIHTCKENKPLKI